MKRKIENIFEKKYRFAVIGRNFVVDWFLSAAETVTNAELVGVCSRNPSEAIGFANKYGIGCVYNGVEELCKADDIDFVYIASPNYMHESQSIAMLSSGKHVLCEKPAAPNAGAFDRICEAAIKHKKVFLEALVPLYTPAEAKIKELIEKIAPVRHIMFNFCQYSSRYDKFKNGIIENAFNPRLCNGSLADIGVYPLSLALDLFGAPRDISAVGYIIPDSIDAEGSVTALYDGMIMNINYSKTVNSIRPSEICGEDGNILIDSMSRPRFITYKPRGGDEIVFDTAAQINGITKPDMAYELEEFLKLVALTESDADTGIAAMKNYLIRTANVISVSDKIRAQCGITYR